MPLGVPRLDNRGTGWDRALRALAVALLLCLVVCSGGCRRGGPADATGPGGDGQTPGPVTPQPIPSGAFPGAVATPMPSAALAVTLSAAISGEGIDSISGLAPSGDGGYVLAGETKASDGDTWDGWMVKVGADGQPAWARACGGAGDEMWSCIRRTSDGGFIVVGITSSLGAGGNDAWLTKFDGGGNQLWTRTYGGPGMEYAQEIQQTSDGGFIVVGGTQPPGGSWDAWLVKADPAGNEVWARTCGGAESDGARSVQQLADGGYIVAGDGIAVLQTSDGGFIVAGGMNYDLWLLTTDGEGNGLSSLTLGGPDALDMAAAVLLAPDGGYVAAGSTGSSGDGSEGWLVAVRASE